MPDTGAAFRSSFGPLEERLGLPLRQVDTAWFRTLIVAEALWDFQEDCSLADTASRSGVASI